MKVFFLIWFSVLFFNCGVKNQAKGQIIDQQSNRILDQVFNKAPSLSNEERLDLDSLEVNEDLFIKPVEFENIYQVDSLLSKYDPNSDFGYVIGKTEKKGYRALFINRFYSEWVQTIEMLTYDSKGVIKGFLILAMSVGDIEDYYELEGYFEYDTLYYAIQISKTSQEINDIGQPRDYDSCYSTVTVSSIWPDGTIVLREKLVNTIECSY